MGSEGKFADIINSWAMDGVKVCPACKRDMGRKYSPSGPSTYCMHCDNEGLRELMREVLDAVERHQNPNTQDVQPKEGGK